MEQVHLSQPTMFQFLYDTFGGVVPQGNAGLGFDEWPKLLERADSGLDTNKALQAVVGILQYLEEASPVSLTQATKILADGSRYGELGMNSPRIDKDYHKGS